MILIINFSKIKYKNKLIKIGITGGTGLLGHLFVKKLKQKGIKFTLFKGNILKINSITKWIKLNKKIEFIFHFAAVSSALKAKDNTRNAYKVNVKGTENLIKAIKNKKIWFFFPSTSHIYKFSKNKIKESFTKKPISYYGKTKLNAEKKIINYKDPNFSFCIGRIFSIYHKNQKKPFLFPSIREKIKLNKKDKIFIKNAFSVRDFLNAEEVVEIIFKIYKKRIKGIYNIGSGKGTTIKKFVKKQFKLKEEIISDNEINSLVSDNNKLNNKIYARKF
tara:strand:- start:427 stop:1254 length:828 start_codon:yes stop_codon:yes gene_type:complete